jgi:hypothetical protein
MINIVFSIVLSIYTFASVPQCKFEEKLLFNNVTRRNMGDSLKLHFQGAFHNEKILVYSNGILIINRKITTNESTGLAFITLLKREPDIFIVLKGQRLRLKENETNFCLVEKRGSVFIITYTDKQPMYK